VERSHNFVQTKHCYQAWGATNNGQKKKTGSLWTQGSIRGEGGQALIDTRRHCQTKENEVGRKRKSKNECRPQEKKNQRFALAPAGGEKKAR
jgi:hypothetical protein